MVPVPEEEASLVLAGSYLGGLVHAVVEPGSDPIGPAAATSLPTPTATTAANTAASMVNLKGLARPEKFDDADEHWLEWKANFRS
eukprot:2205973-Heterocapsa_arctica.AAC.1